MTVAALAHPVDHIDVERLQELYVCWRSCGTWPLVLTAQRAGDIRSDLTLEEVVHVAAIAKISGDTRYREPIPRAALDAFRPAKSQAATRVRQADRRRP